MRYVNRSVFSLALATITLALAGSYLVYYQNERGIAASARQFLQESPAQEGALETAQIFHRIFCNKGRHSFCSARVLNTKNQSLTSVPTLTFEAIPFYAQSIRLPLNQFEPPLYVILTFVPSLISILLWSAMAFGTASLVGLIAWSFGLRATKQSLERNLKLELELKKIEMGLGSLASQVAHDIRSPLAALDAMMSRLVHLAEDDRIIIRGAIRRMKDIANNLIEKNREVRAGIKTNTIRPKTETFEPAVGFLVSSLVEPLITEKRMQFRSESGVEIDGLIDDASYCLFAQIQPTEFQRVLSNLVNNSVEALDGHGLVTINVTTTADRNIKITIQDNGKGIPPEILPLLGQRGETHGKVDGSGLGLFHARTSVESWGGKLELTSTVGVGTIVCLEIPLANQPEWLASSITLVPGTTVVVTDDDPSVHQIWDQRLTRFGDAIRVIHLHTLQDLLEWYRTNVTLESVLHLCDYEFAESKQTGLDLIEMIGISEHTILVTNRWDDLEVRRRCEKIQLRLLPKSMAGSVDVAVND